MIYFNDFQNDLAITHMRDWLDTSLQEIKENTWIIGGTVWINIFKVIKIHICYDFFLLENRVVRFAASQGGV